MRILLSVALAASALVACGGGEAPVGQGGEDAGNVHDGSVGADGGHTSADASTEASLDGSADTSFDAPRESSLADVASDGAGCGPGEVSVVSTGCSPVGPPSCGDAGTLQGNCCQTTACQTLPASCNGTLSCSCASSLCPQGYMCSVDSTSPTTLSCGFYPP
jgi:hypothetical protein